MRHHDTADDWTPPKGSGIVPIGLGPHLRDVAAVTGRCWTSGLLSDLRTIVAEHHPLSYAPVWRPKAYRKEQLDSYGIAITSRRPRRPTGAQR